MLEIVSGDGPYGARLLATEPIVRGQVICRIENFRVLNKATYQTIQISAHQHIEELGVLAYLNHSCRPNVIVHTGHLVCYATRDILAGEELTYFYPSTEVDMARPFVCMCGALECIHLVAGARYLSLHVLSRHFTNEHIHEVLLEGLRKASELKNVLSVGAEELSVRSGKRG